MTTKVFIAHDSISSNDGNFSSNLTALKDHPPEGYQITVFSVPDEPGQASIWDENVKKGIDESDEFVAFMDYPNANVGFEIGYALGSQKKVKLALYGLRQHEWSELPPLADQLQPRVETYSKLKELVIGTKCVPNPPPHTLGDRVFIVCPEVAGEGHRQYIPKDLDCEFLSHAAKWTPLQLPEKLHQAGLIVWIITPHSDGNSERDGKENASLAVVAGYALSQKIPIAVLRDKKARPVVDAMHREIVLGGPRDLASSLHSVIDGWKAEIAARSIQSPDSESQGKEIPAHFRPTALPVLPRDFWVDQQSKFIGRQAQLRDARESIRGLQSRFERREDSEGAQSVRLVWVHGFGGMGKSWFLHRVRFEAKEQMRRIFDLVVDFNPEVSNEFKSPLTDIPGCARDLFNPIAYRLAQKAGVEVVDPYWQAIAKNDRVASKYQEMSNQFDQQIAEMESGDYPRVSDRLRKKIEHALGDPELRHADPQLRKRRIQNHLLDSKVRANFFEDWCKSQGQHDRHVYSPDYALAEALRQSLRCAMDQAPVILILDTLEVLEPQLHFWLRDLLLPLVVSPDPICILLGSRLRPDVEQPNGSRFGWLRDEKVKSRTRVDAFAELLRFNVDEVESALEKCSRPVDGELHAIAEQVHRVTLGVPLATRSLIDLHEDGDSVLSQLGNAPPANESLSDQDAVRKVIEVTANRMLLHLQDQPGRRDDYEAIVDLAILTSADAKILHALWGDKSKQRLTALGKRYSLLAEGDLHETVRMTLRRHWRQIHERPDFFDQSWERISCVCENLLEDKPNDRTIDRIQAILQRANLIGWKDPMTAFQMLARGICLAAVYGLDPELFRLPLLELPLNGEQRARWNRIWRGGDLKLLNEPLLVEWLREQAVLTKDWSDEELAALALLRGVITPLQANQRGELLSQLHDLMKAVEFFGAASLPRRAACAASAFELGYQLQVGLAESENSPESSGCESAYKLALALNYENASWVNNNLGNLYQNQLGKPKDAEQSYLKAIELDPKLAYPHNGLGNLYQDHLGMPKDAEQYYLKAIELDPKNAVPHNGLGNLYQNHLGKPKDAERCYLKAIELDPKYAAPNNGLGNLYKDYLHEFSQAEKYFKQAIAIAGPTNQAYGSGHVGLAEIAEIGERWEDADRLFQIASNSGRRQWDLSTGIGWIHLLARGDIESAEVSHTEATQIAEDSSQVALLGIATQVARHGWTGSKDLLKFWIASFPTRERGYLWMYRRRFAWLLRQIHTENGIPKVLEMMRSANNPDIWDPWISSLEALVEAREIEEIQDPQSRDIYRLLMRSNPPNIRPPSPS